MTTSELVAYIENNHLEYQMVNILMFNENGFAYLPVVNPQLLVDKSGESIEVLGFNGINLFSNEYRVPSFRMPEELKTLGMLNKCIYHPENLRAYMIRQNETVGVEIFYGRKRDAAKQLRNAAFETFAAFNSLETVDQFNQFYRRSKRIQRQYRKGIGTTEYNRLIEDSALDYSIQNAGESIDELLGTYSIRLFEAWKAVFQQRYATTSIIGEFSDSIMFSAQYPRIEPIKTPLDRNITIINSEDEIPNILYRLSYDLKATKMFVATGYMYESGIRKLLPSFFSMDNIRGATVELIIGDLQKYARGAKCKTPNRATAVILNNLLGTHVVNRILTSPSKFYHGKFYYISNDSVSYIIMGSSNVTLSAYQKNKEFDVLYRFDHETGIDPLEQEFLDWYEALKGECMELSILDENMFPSNLNIDEDGASYGNSILKTITQEEERERFRFLEGFSPSKIETGLFRGKLYQPFRDYMLFLYPERSISIIESFSYGKSCYIFGSTDVDYIRQQICAKSKDQVKNADSFIANIDHDSNYMDEVTHIFDSH